MEIKAKKRAGSETGQAMVEFVMVLPLLLLLIMGCMEISWYMISKNNLNEYASIVGHNVQPPFWIVWSESAKPRDWIDVRDGRKPSWLSTQEKALWSFDEYDGWYALTDPGPGEVIGSNYPYTAFDNEEKFKQRINNSSTMIDKSGVSYTVKGGYYINAEGIQFPAGGGGGWKEKRFSEKMEYYTADIRVDMVYDYKPLTPVGEWLFCRDGRDYVEMRMEGRYIYNLEPAIYG